MTTKKTDPFARQKAAEDRAHQLQDEAQRHAHPKRVIGPTARFQFVLPADVLTGLKHLALTRGTTARQLTLDALDTAYGLDTLANSGKKNHPRPVGPPATTPSTANVCDPQARTQAAAQCRPRQERN